MKAATFFAIVLACGGVASAQTVGRPALGVQMSDNTSGGVLVTGVLAGSPAAQIGLRAGDRILAVNKQPVANYRDVIRQVGGTAPGTTVELDVVRGVWRTSLSAQLGRAEQVLRAAPLRVIQPVTIPAATMRGTSVPTRFDFSPADINDQHAYGG
jgi:C-terminal processing protease CtpA/Prc